MSLVTGNLQGLSPSQVRRIEKLGQRKISDAEIINRELARELYLLAKELRRQIALLIDRTGKIERVVVGQKDILFLPELGRYRIGKGRIRRIRLVISDLSKNPEKTTIAPDILVDLEKLRLDMVAAVKLKDGGEMSISYAWNRPVANAEEAAISEVKDRNLATLEYNFSEQIILIENELENNKLDYIQKNDNAFLVGIYSDSRVSESRMSELMELARTDQVNVVGRFIQKRKPDPRTLVGKGKITEIMLQAIRLNADLLIFDTELSPSQWRSITNITDLKVIDRSMLILDIFARHATSHDGKLQVELAQLKYNLPKLVEKDKGLSRLTGGIGGRGPGETKLEVSRRYYRDRIRNLENQIDKLSKQRALRRKRRVSVPIPLVALVGYTNVGKSSLFNTLTNSAVIAENKLFATLDTTQRKLFFDDYEHQAVVSDTVGFIRELPEELVNAFRATLEEIGQAKLLLHVMDASDPEIEKSYEAVEKQLNDSGFSEIPRINIINKCDLVNPERVKELEDDFSGIGVSAVSRQGLDKLLERVRGDCLLDTITS